MSYSIGVYASQAAMEREEPAAQGTQLSPSSAAMALTLAGTFIHVYVDRSSRRPVPIPTATKNALDAIYAPTAAL